MENKQTAVDIILHEMSEIVGIISPNAFDVIVLKELYNKAKKMERNQIEKAYCDGFDDGYLLANGENTKFDDCYLYYNETYGK